MERTSTALPRAIRILLAIRTRLASVGGVQALIAPTGCIQRAHTRSQLQRGASNIHCSEVGPWRVSLRFSPERRLTVSYTNANNVFGITGDRAQLTTGCTKNQLVTPGNGRLKAKRLFQFCLFYDPARDRSRRYRHCIRRQRHRDRQRTRSGECRFRSIENDGAWAAGRICSPISGGVFQHTKPSAVREIPMHNSVPRRLALSAARQSTDGSANWLSSSALRVVW